MAEDDEMELKALFAPATKDGVIDAETLSELQFITRVHSLPAQELFYKWESYCLKMGDNDMRLNAQTVKSLKQDVQDHFEKEIKHKSHNLNTGKRSTGTPRAGGGDGVFGM